MGLDFAIDELYSSGWAALDTAGCKPSGDGRWVPGIDRIRDELARLGLTLRTKHVQLFDCVRAEWLDAGGRVLGSVVGSTELEAGVYARSEMVARCSATGEVMKRMGNRSEEAAPHGVYPCRPEAGAEPSERWIAIAVHDDAAWTRLVAAMGRPDWASAPRYATAAGRLADFDVLDEAIAEWTREQDAQALTDALQAAGVEAGVVRDFAQLAVDPQLAARGHFVRLEHPVLGELAFERAGFRLSETPGGLERPGPLLGADTATVLRELLGLDSAAIDDLVARGVTV